MSGHRKAAVRAAPALLMLAAFVLAVMFCVFKLIDKIVGLRVSREEELKGLDITQHGMESYAGFEVFTTK